MNRLSRALDQTPLGYFLCELGAAHIDGGAVIVPDANGLYRLFVGGRQPTNHPLDLEGALSLAICMTGQTANQGHNDAAHVGEEE